QAVAAAETAVATAQAEADAAGRAIGGHRTAETAARDALQRAEGALTRKSAEEKAIAGVLAADAARDGQPVVEALDGEPGWGAALGAALGDDLTVGTDPPRPAPWEDLNALEAVPPLPEGAEPLAARVRQQGPLARRLSQIGVVETAETAAALQERLLPGQRLVTRAGGMWRWDGLTLRPGAPTAAARRLEQRNRLMAIRAELPPLEQAVAAAREELRTAQEKLRTATEAERTARDAARRGQTALDNVRRQLGEIQKRAGAHAARIAATEAGLARIAEELAEAERQAEAARAAADGIPDAAPLREQAERQR